jgi:hypothetical protein
MLQVRRFLARECIGSCHYPFRGPNGVTFQPCLWKRQADRILVLVRGTGQRNASQALRRGNGQRWLLSSAWQCHFWFVVECLRSRYTNESFHSPEVYDWKSLEKDDLVVDVGGGVGAVTLTLAKSFPHLRYVVQDRPSVVPKGVKVCAIMFPFYNTL